MARIFIAGGHKCGERWPHRLVADAEIHPAGQLLLQRIGRTQYTQLAIGVLFAYDTIGMAVQCFDAKAKGWPVDVRSPGIFLSIVYNGAMGIVVQHIIAAMLQGILHTAVIAVVPAGFVQGLQQRAFVVIRELAGIYILQQKMIIVHKQKAPCHMAIVDGVPDLVVNIQLFVAAASHFFGGYMR